VDTCAATPHSEQRTFSKLSSSADIFASFGVSLIPRAANGTLGHLGNNLGRAITELRQRRKNEAALRAMTVALNLAPHDRHAARCLAGG
jgi:hypothetical protein